MFKLVYLSFAQILKILLKKKFPKLFIYLESILLLPRDVDICEGGRWPVGEKEREQNKTRIINMIITQSKYFLQTLF